MVRIFLQEPTIFEGFIEAQKKYEADNLKKLTIDPLEI